jgi:branched-chain amino acid transport system substrate-binding protein
MRRSSSALPPFSRPGLTPHAGLLTETAQRIGSLDSDKLREALLPLKTKTVLGDFALDERGYQTAHKAITIQWQNGQQVVVWPDDVTSGKPRFPSPPWSQR